MLFQSKYLLAASANGGSSARGGHWCAHWQRRAIGGGAQRAGVGAAWAAVAQRTGGWRVQVTGVLAGGAEVTGNAELGGGAQRAGWGRHGRRWCRGRF